MWMPSLSQRVAVSGYRNLDQELLSERSRTWGSQSTAFLTAALGPLAQAWFRWRLYSERFGNVFVGTFALPRLTAKHGIRGGLVISAALVLWTFHASFLSAVSGALAALVTAAGTGVAAGVLHSLSGPDHIAGLAAVAINQPVASAVGIAAVWAAGHVIGQCGVGAALVLMRALGAPLIKQVHFEKWSTIAVAVTLMIIGTAGIVEARAASDEGEEEENGLQAQQTMQPQQKLQKLKRTFTTGFVHGLSPDGLFMLFPLLTLSASGGMMHLLGIFAGTCLSMSACTAGLSFAARRLQQYSAKNGVGMGRMQNMISVASSFVAIAFGGIMLCTGVLRAF
jgi:sulfite exporter TauE/SafE